MRWTADSVAEGLRQYHRDHGPFRESDIYRDDPALYSATRSRYGSIRRAAEELLLPLVRATRTWDKAAVVAALRERSAANKTLAFQVVHNEDCGLVQAARRHFGSWKKAKAAAGVS
jgi:hypothetical protein